MHYRVKQTNGENAVLHALETKVVCFLATDASSRTFTHQSVKSYAYKRAQRISASMKTCIG